MLQVLNKTHNTATVQFTGADLKQWYAVHGPSRQYICHVLESVVADANVCNRKHITPSSHELIEQFKEAVPYRFTAKGSGSSVISNHMMRKYFSKSKQRPAYHTRANLIKCVPDDHVFKLFFS